MAGLVGNSHRVLVNAKALNAPLTGVQRYILELLSRLGDRVEAVRPRRSLFFGRGLLWEQAVLPLYARGRLLFSPANIGPLAVKRQVVTVHDLATVDHPECFNPLFREYYRFLLPRLARRVRAVITPSAFTRERLVEWAKVAPSQVQVIPLGVDGRFRPQEAQAVEGARLALGIPSPYYVLSLGTLEPRKNLPRLLSAWERVQRELPEEVWLVVAGGEGKRTVFRELVLERVPPRVHFTGRVPDDLLPPLYAGALAFVYPSLYEGFGLPPLEAMASGTPVLASNAASLPEVVGDAGLLVNPYDVEAIAHGIRQLVQDAALREELRRRGLERAKRFTWERTAEETWALLQAL